VTWSFSQSSTECNELKTVQLHPDYACPDG
jgi:hypothetical protein